MTLTERTTAALAEIDRRKAVADAATSGPWIAEDNWVGKGHSSVATTCHYAHDADAAFIAASRNERPGELDALRAAIVGLLEMHTWPHPPLLAERTLTAILDGMGVPK